MQGAERAAGEVVAALAAPTLAGIGLPGFANFWGELGIFVALWKFSPWFCAAAVAGVVISAGSMVRALARSTGCPMRETFRMAIRVNVPH